MLNTKYIVKKDQNLIDIAVTNYGSEWIRGVEMIIEHNDVNLADELVPGTELEIKDLNTNDLQLQYLKARGIHVVTGNYQVPLPATPTELTAVVLSDTENELTWTDNADNETGFEIQRSADGATWETIAEVGEDVTELIDDLSEE